MIKQADKSYHRPASKRYAIIVIDSFLFCLSINNMQCIKDYYGNKEYYLIIIIHTELMTKTEFVKKKA